MLIWTLTTISSGTTSIPMFKTVLIVDKVWARVIVLVIAPVSGVDVGSVDLSVPENGVDVNFSTVRFKHKFSLIFNQVRQFTDIIVLKN